MKNEIFNRSSSNGHIISDHYYNMIIGATLSWGFFVNWYLIQIIPSEKILSLGLSVFLIGYFISCFIGVYLFNTFDNPLISFIGYNFVVAPLGCVVNILVSRYSTVIVLNAMTVTGVVVVTMMVLGTIYPKFFKNIYKTLNMSLVIVIIVELINIIFYNADIAFIDWIAALIFAGYIGYDWGRANHIPKTIDNAIDSAAALYIDIINMFIKILRIMGRKK